MDMTKHLYAQLKEVSEIRGRNKRIERLKEFDSPHLAIILDLAFNPHISFNMETKDFVWTPSRDSEQSLIYRLKQEAKKLVNLTNVGPYPNLPMNKKEFLLRTILETLHPDDAQLLLSVMNKQLPFEKIDKEMAIELYPQFREKWIVKDAEKEENS